MQKTISQKISELRKANSLTQEQLGGMVGVSGQAVSKWENNEALPDILLLPKLCEILGTSLDNLFEVPTNVRNKNIVSNFFRYSSENGISNTIIESISRSFSPSGKPQDGSAVYVSKEELRIYDMNGMGFVTDNVEFIKSCLVQESDDIAFYLRILADDTCLSVLRLISIDKAITRVEIAEKLQIDEDTINRILLGFIKRKMVCCDVDNDGKRGYMFDCGMVGLIMILAGCKTLNQGNAFNQWFSRK